MTIRNCALVITRHFFMKNDPKFDSFQCKSKKSQKRAFKKFDFFVYICPQHASDSIRFGKLVGLRSGPATGGNAIPPAPPAPLATGGRGRLKLRVKLPASSADIIGGIKQCCCNSGIYQFSEKKY